MFGVEQVIATSEILVRSIDSISNSRWYCLTSAFFGSTRIFLRDASSRSSSVATTGRRPTNSGNQQILRLDLAENFTLLAIMRTSCWLLPQNEQ
jgi:hypothetical protein